jgi:hypothetical protein
VAKVHGRSGDGERRGELHLCSGMMES